MLAFEAGDQDAALADLTRAWELSQDPEVLYNRAVVHQAMGGWRQAIADLDQVIEADPAEPDGWLTRASCRARTGDQAGAAADACRFTTLAPQRAAEAAGLLRSPPGPAHARHAAE